MKNLVFIGDSYYGSHHNWNVGKYWENTNGLSLCLQKKYRNPTIESFPGQTIVQKASYIAEMIVRNKDVPTTYVLALGGNDLRKKLHSVDEVLGCFSKIVHLANATPGTFVVISALIPSPCFNHKNWCVEEYCEHEKLGSIAMKECNERLKHLARMYPSSSGFLDSTRRFEKLIGNGYVSNRAHFKVGDIHLNHGGAEALMDITAQFLARLQQQ